MTFFAGSSCITISGGTFTSNLPTQDAVRCSSRNSNGLMIIQADEVDLHRELISGSRYRVYYASHRGRFVVVRTFEGPCAKQDWVVDTALSRKVFHPNLLKTVGVSDESSERHFILFHGITSEQKMQSLIAKALKTDLNTSVQLSMKAVKGIAAGLSYLKSQSIPIHAGGPNFDIFIGHGNEPIISFHPSYATHDDGLVSQNFDIETGDCGIEALNRLCQQLFSGANSILYDDSPERKFDAYNREDHLTVTLEDSEGASNISESEAILNPSSSTEKSKSSLNPRREVWWLDLGAKNQCLESIKQCFEDYLDRFLVSESNPLLRRIRSPKDNILRRNLHQCPGYLREEITLTSDVSRSAIVSHAFPSQSELCSICGQLVQYAYSDPSITDEEIELSEDVHQSRENVVHGSSFTMNVKSPDQHVCTQHAGIRSMMAAELEFMDRQMAWMSQDAEFGIESGNQDVSSEDKIPPGTWPISLITDCKRLTIDERVSPSARSAPVHVSSPNTLKAEGSHMHVIKGNLTEDPSPPVPPTIPPLSFEDTDLSSLHPKILLHHLRPISASNRDTVVERPRRERPLERVRLELQATNRRMSDKPSAARGISALSESNRQHEQSDIHRYLKQQQVRVEPSRVGDPEAPVSSSRSGGDIQGISYAIDVLRHDGLSTLRSQQLIERFRRERESARTRNVGIEPESTPVATNTPTGTKGGPRWPDGRRFFMRRETHRTEDERRSTFSSAAAQHINQEEQRQFEELAALGLFIR